LNYLIAQSKFVVVISVVVIVVVAAAAAFMYVFMHRYV